MARSDRPDPKAGAPLALQAESQHFGVLVARVCTERQHSGPRLAVALAGLWGCGGSSGPQASPVQWLGLDTRALAVGSQIPVSLQFATDGGAVRYAASSSNSGVVAVDDQGDQELVLSVLDAGDATLEVTSNFGASSLPVVATAPAALNFVVLSHLKAGVDTALPGGQNGFALVYAGSEVVQAQVLDQGGNVLNSWGLVQAGSHSSSLQVTTSEPEEFALTAITSEPMNATFVAAIAGEEDAGTVAVTVKLPASAPGGRVSCAELTES